MKNILQAFKYVIKNILPLSVFALPAALFFAYKYNSSYFIDYLLDIGSVSDKPFSDIYLHFTLLPSFNVPVILLWVSVLVLSFSLMLSYIERHMKYGIKSFFKSFTSINYSLLAVLPATLTIILIGEAFSFLLAVVVNLFKYSSGAVTPFVLPAVYTLMIFLALTVISIFVMWIPIKLVTGYKNKDSLRYSIRLFQGRQIKLLAGIALPLIIASPVMMVIKNFVPLNILNPVLYVLFYIVLLSYYAAFIMVSYFDYTGAYRKDIKVKLFSK